MMKRKKTYGGSGGHFCYNIQLKWQR